MIYGYMTRSARFIPTGATLQGAKMAATKAGCINVGSRPCEGGTVKLICIKDGGSWS